MPSWSSPAATAFASSRARDASSRGASPGRKPFPRRCARWGSARGQTTARASSQTGAISACSASAAARRAPHPDPHAPARAMIELGLTPTLIQPVILCGGSGTRLWPLSREHEPKPLHALNGERTLLQQTALRCAALSATAEPILVCNEAHRFLVTGQLAAAGAKPKSVLLEPVGRGTAPALTLAAVHAVTADDPVLLAMPSDHAIADPAAFARA